VCAVSINCAKLEKVCNYYTGHHREPFTGVILQEPPPAEEPPEGWHRSFSRSTLILGSREDLLSDAWVPVFWRTDGCESTAQILEWTRTKLAMVPAEAQIGRRPAIPVPRNTDWHYETLEASGFQTQKTKKGCVCSGNCNGDWECNVFNECGGSPTDECNPEPSRSKLVAMPSLRASEADAELGMALWLHMLWDQTEFHTAGRTGTALSQRGRARKQLLLDFLLVGCQYWPRDSEDVAKEDGEQGAAHCRESFCSLRKYLRRNWKRLTVRMPGRSRAVHIDGVRLEKGWQMCGQPWKAWSTRQWHECKGSFVSTRQLPCGIWTALHMILAHSGEAEAQAIFNSIAAQIEAKANSTIFNPKRVPEMPTSPRHLVARVRRFLKEFFACTVCVQNLLAAPYDEDSIKWHHDAMLWFWTLHNHVNRAAFLSAPSEKAFAEDPAMLSQHSWPSAALCPACHKKRQDKTQESNKSEEEEKQRMAFDSYVCRTGKCIGEGVEWDLDAVYQFLCAFYGYNPLQSPARLKGTGMQFAKVGLRQEVDSWPKAQGRGHGFGRAWRHWLPPIWLLALPLLAAYCFQRSIVCHWPRSSTPAAAGSPHVAPLYAEEDLEETQRLIAGPELLMDVE